MWDVGGQKSLRSYWRNYFECTDGLVWVVDSADKRRLQDCMNELHSLLLEEVLLICKKNESYYKYYLQRLAGATLLIFANKQDLPGALGIEQLKETLELDKIKTHHWKIVSCSAVTGENLLDGIDWLVSDIAARIFTLD